MLWICATDRVAFSVGAPRCPQCGGTTYREEHEDQDGPVHVIGEEGELAGESGPVEPADATLPPEGDETELDTTPAPTGRKK